MRKTTPSQVVTFIDHVFPISEWDKFETGGIPLTEAMPAAGQLRALVDLVDHIPDHLLALPPDQFSSLVTARSTIIQCLENLKSDSRASLRPMPNMGVAKNELPMAAIRRALINCPDESPSSKSSPILFVDDVELRSSIEVDIASAEASLAASAWKASTVIAAAAIEALLLWKLRAHQDKIESLLSEPSLKGVGGVGPPGDLTHKSWGLAGYVRVAELLEIITAETAISVNLCREYRNLIHPARAQRLSMICNRATALSAIAALEHVVQNLREKI